MPPRITPDPVRGAPRARASRPGVLGLLGFGLVGVGVLGACGASEAGPPPSAPFSTLPGVGEVPQALSFDPLDGDVTGDDPTVTTASTEPRDTVDRPDDLGPIGDRVAGNRLLVIGDSITASTARRYGGEMCFTLLPLGWAVEVNAEVSRFVDFGHRVLDRRLWPDDGVDWDAAVVFLGSNYGGDIEAFRGELHGILDRLEPRPTLLVTVTEFRPNRADVNEVIRGMLEFYPQVEVIDWAEITRIDRSLLSGDGLHLSPDGRARLAGEVAMALGPAPSGPAGDGVAGDGAAGDGTSGDAPDGDAGDRPVGECLSTSFTDDSGATRPGVAPPPPTIVATGPATTSSPTTVATTAPPTNSPGTSAPTTVATTPSSTTDPSTAAPATTAPATTAAATTAPATTAPASTAATTTVAPPTTEPPPAPTASSTTPATSPATSPATTEG